jgi:hypothetical protein
MAKAGLFVGRALAYPFDIPQKMNVSATNVGQAANGAVNGINAAIATSYMKLEPKGPAKWLVPLFQKVNDATIRSDKIATRNKTVFWDPLGNGMDQVGMAVGGPFAYHYARKAGVENPTPNDIYALLYKRQPPGGGGGGGAADAGAGAHGGQASGGAGDAAAAAAQAEAAAQAAAQAQAAQAQGGQG